jgi:formate dehydrogenase major subunit
LRHSNNRPDAIQKFSPPDAVTVKVCSDKDGPEGMVFMPFCYAEAAANFLANPVLDPFGKIPEFRFCAARVTPTRPL